MRLFGLFVALCVHSLAVTTSSVSPSSTIPVISIADRTPVAGVSMVIGIVEKEDKNPLFVQASRPQV
jgi:hypothetical protein